MKKLNPTQDIDLVKIVDDVWRENELYIGTYKVAALTAMQRLMELSAPKEKRERKYYYLRTGDPIRKGDEYYDHDKAFDWVKIEHEPVFGHEYDEENCYRTRRRV